MSGANNEKKIYPPTSPVITQPIVGVMPKRWVIVDASSSLSLTSGSQETVNERRLSLTYRDFALRYYHRGVPPSDSDCGMPRARYCFEGIFYINRCDEPKDRDVLNAERTDLIQTTFG